MEFPRCLLLFLSTVDYGFVMPTVTSRSNVNGMSSANKKRKQTLCPLDRVILKYSFTQSHYFISLWVHSWWIRNPRSFYFQKRKNRDNLLKDNGDQRSATTNIQVSKTNIYVICLSDTNLWGHSFQRWPLHWCFVRNSIYFLYCGKNVLAHDFVSWLRCDHSQYRNNCR